MYNTMAGGHRGIQWTRSRSIKNSIMSVSPHMRDDVLWWRGTASSAQMTLLRNVYGWAPIVTLRQDETSR